MGPSVRVKWKQTETLWCMLVSSPIYIYHRNTTKSDIVETHMKCAEEHEIVADYDQLFYIGKVPLKAELLCIMQFFRLPYHMMDMVPISFLQHAPHFIILVPGS